MRGSVRRAFLPALLAVGCLFALLGVLDTPVGASPHVAAPGLDAPNGPALAPNPTPGASWTVADGGAEAEWDVYVTGSGISGLAIDGTTLWAASSGGLLKWDGDSGDLVQYLAPRFPLPSNSLTEVLLRTENLYISGLGGVAVFDRDDDWTLYTNEDIGLDIGYYAPMAFVGDVLWVAGEDGIAQLFPDGHWETIHPGTEVFPTHYFQKIVPQPDGVYVVVALEPGVEAERQVVRFAEGAWEIVDRPLILYPEALDGSLWKGDNRTLLKSENRGKSWIKVLKTERPVRPIAFDAQGSVYATENDVLYVLKDDRVVETLRFTGAGPEVHFTNILEWDSAGRLWIATDGRGLTMFDGERWYNWQDGMAGMRDDCIRGMAVGAHKLYAGTHGSAGTGGVNILDLESQQWTNLWPGESELSGGGVDGIAIDDQGRVYLPTSEGVLDIYSDGTWEHIPMPLPEGYILSTSEGLFDQEGNYWLGTRGLGLGLWKYDGSTWMTYDIPAHINGLALDAEGRLWLATSAGLVVRDLDTRWLVYTGAQLPLGNDWIQDVAIDDEGRVWMIGNTCLVVFNGQEFQEFAPSLAGASMWGDALAFGPGGDLWVEAGHGIATFKGEPAIGGFVSLALPPHGSIPEEQIMTVVDEVADRDLPAPGAVSPGGNWLRMAVLGAAAMTCLLILLVGGLILFFALRRRQARDVTEGDVAS